jgi:mono/diheme cytochrome c family protein
LDANGERLFRSKGCVACHTVGGGNRTGPDLEGVTDRREYGWIAAMIINPDSMIKADPIARQLLADYMTPMLSLAVTADEARSIYEYLRQRR